MATAWWGVWTGAAARRWAGQDPGKGAVGVCSTPEGIPTPHPRGSVTLCAEQHSLVLQELKLVPDVESEHCEG